MSLQQTLALIKPEATRQKKAGPIIFEIEKKGFVIQKIEILQLSKAKAREFYIAHKERPFYDELCAYISSGPVLALLLKKENAIADFRALMGTTDPDTWEPGTLRYQFGTSLEKNAVHGSDSPENAKKEIALLFT